MNVAIHRRFDAGMTEQFLQHFWLRPAFDCTRCIGVAQCVHTGIFQFLLRRIDCKGGYQLYPFRACEKGHTTTNKL